MRKSVVLVAVMLVLALGVAWAGEQGKAKMTSAEKAAKLQSKLGLNDAQTTQVKTVLDEFAPRWDALMAKKEAGTDISAEKKALREEQETRLKSIFSAEQWAQYQEMHSQDKKTKKQARE
ncbi:MAG: hypothetical protein ACRD4D_00295 [Candidatus Acidiferrales bacterium]